MSLCSGGFGTVPAGKATKPVDPSASAEAGPEGGAAGGSADGPSNEAVEVLFAQVNERWMSSVKTSTDGAPVCAECGRDGHPCCGLRYWTSLRAVWLKTTEEEVLRVPRSFEDPGPLQLARVGSAAGPVRDLSDGELEDLEECLDAVQRPFPPLRRRIPLPQAVQCAEALWDTDD
mmetsp:Transcript_16823/g.37982  ORF Transcript_16823/g.37982 Transcript_16823/m.37982 type:complete len:175 (-) Transcript_16823:219-743(-)